MRRWLSYANVMSTLAVFVALGGSAYAALKITGKQVVDGSLTGRDIKKKSVGLDRLRGRLPAGPKGATGPAGAKGDAGTKGDTGPPGPVDSSQFLPAAGISEVTAGPAGWVSNNAAFPRTNITYNQATFTSSNASDGATLALSPALPAVLAGKAMRLRGARLCWDALDTNILITAVYVTVTRDDSQGNNTTVGEESDESDHDEKTCRHYDVDPPLELSSGAHVSVRLSVGWEATSRAMKVGGATFELERTP